MLAGEDVRSLAYWRAFDRISPIGDERFDYVMSAVVRVIEAAAGAKPGGPLENMMQWGAAAAPRYKTDEEMLGLFMGMKRAQERGEEAD